MIRLSADFWIAAYRARLEALGIPLYVVHRGDDRSGAVLVKLATLDGAARLYGRTPELDGRRPWNVIAEGPEAEVDAAVARQRAVDPDLWVVAVEDRAGRTLLDLPGLDD